MRVLERPLAVLTLAAGSVWAVYVLLFGSDAGLRIPVFLVLVWGGAGVLGLWILRFGVHLFTHKRTPGSRRVARLLLEPAALALCFALVWTGAAFWLRFHLSKPALEAYVRNERPALLAGTFKPGVRVGLFWLREAEVVPQGVVRLITTDCMFNDCGLVYSPAAQPPVIGEDTYRPLGGPWYHWWRSW